MIPLLNLYYSLSVFRTLTAFPSNYSTVIDFAKFSRLVDFAVSSHGDVV